MRKDFMANHNIAIHKAGPERIPEPAQVALVAGDTVTFVTSPGADSILCFEAHTLAVLTPPPATATLEVAGGTSTSFEIGPVESRDYVIVLQAPGWPIPTDIDGGSTGGAATLKLKKADGTDYTDPPASGGGTDERG